MKPVAPPARPPARREAALKAIIGYKLARAGVSLLGAATGLVLYAGGYGAGVQSYFEAVHDHAVSALALRLSHLVISAVSSRHLLVVAGALGLDAATLLVEGWALLRGWAWGAWLVVGLTGALVPFEVVELVRHPSVVRSAVLAINAVIVGWLVRHALRRRPH